MRSYVQVILGHFTRHTDLDSIQILYPQIDFVVCMKRVASVRLSRHLQRTSGYAQGAVLLYAHNNIMRV